MASKARLLEIGLVYTNVKSPLALGHFVFATERKPHSNVSTVFMLIASHFFPVLHVNA
jgi:hypothetical protein